MDNSFESSSLPQHISANNYLTIDSLRPKECFKFRVTYLGSVEILISMKLLDFNTRKAIARDCIYQIKGNNAEKTNSQCSQYISNLICREHSDTAVNFELSERFLELKDVGLNFVLVKHEIPQISFVCGGDENSSDFIAYIAKDVTEWRACYVLSCDQETVKNILNAMDITFNQKFKDYMKAEKEIPNFFPLQIKPSSLKCNKKSNLFDESHPKSKNASTPSKKRASIASMGKLETSSKLTEFNMEKMLQSEIWYHGSITRSHAEALIQKDGDFLVRDSQKSKGQQFVLSGLLAGHPKHLLLVDPDGKVRTKDQIFDNIPHLINHHWRNRLPIISADSTLLVLRKPIRRKTIIEKRPIIN